MKWASHLSTKDNVEACVDESIAAVRSQMGGDSVHLTVIFVSPQFKDKYNEIPELIRERMDPGRFLGCSGGGIVGGGREVEQQPAFSITCANLPDVEIKNICSDTMNLPDQNKYS
jgi:small ligand-binding sensory domain FIST